jgi:hypothetical protein
MANRYAVATGNWSNPATWDGGTLPQAGDDVRPNNFIVTIDQNITVNSLTNNALSPATYSGRFSITTPVTLNCNIVYYPLTNAPTYGYNELCKIQSTGTVNIIGNITSTGNLNGGAFNSAISIESNCTVNHTGNATGGGNTVGYGEPGSAIKITSTCTFNGVGTYTGGSGYDNVGGYNACIAVVQAAGTVTLNITGNLIGGPAILTPAVYIQNNNNSTLNVTGIVQSGLSSPAILTQFNGPRNSGILTRVNVTGSIINVNGINAVNSPTLKVSSTSNVTWLMQTENALVDKTLYSANALTGFPVIAKVESGTVYGPTSEFTGTMLPWDATFAQALATAQSNLQLPAILGAITS